MKTEHKKSCKSGNNGPEWSGYPNPANPDNEWICDECGGVIDARWSLRDEGRSDGYGESYGECNR